MTTFLLVLLTGLDLVIVGIILTSFRKSHGTQEVLEDLTEERRAIMEIKNDFTKETLNMREENKKQYDQIVQAAAEFERETHMSKTTISSHLQEIIDDFTKKLEPPIIEITKKHHLLESTLKKADLEKNRLISSIKKAEKICRFFQNEIPYQELLKDIEFKKYEDARKLITQGYSSDKIARELDINTSEVELIKGMSL